MGKLFSIITRVFSNFWSSRNNSDDLGFK